MKLRHPLLERRLAGEGGVCIPATLELVPSDSVLVLSGPNTGGKTVALKSVGLAVLMAQSGIPLPAQEVELPLYRQVRVDIGDHQSIEASLSTYSAHVRAIAGSIRDAAPPALLLFDEIGTGTEPTEGAALARAILESLVGRGITTVATTHLGPVKAWAVTTPGAVCASMDFDTETLMPTYRIVLGAAGRSAGLEIAARLGLPGSVVDRARSLLDPRIREGEDYLRRLREALADAEARADEVRREQRELEAARRRWEADSEREAESRRREAERKLSRALEEFHRRARREVAGLRDPAERARAERRWQRADRRMRSAAIRERAALAGPETNGRPAGHPVDPARLEPGDRVWVERLGRAGRVESVDGDQATVRLGTVVFRERVRDLWTPSGPDESHAGAAGARSQRESATYPSVDCSRELNLIGRRVDEALDALDRYLDAARVAGHEEIRVVHGHGTGRLRRAVREFLDGHAHVRGQRPGKDYEGGDGATVVRLR
jgi:DNA mismatch repair protein MutS2